MKILMWGKGIRIQLTLDPMELKMLEDTKTNQLQVATNILLPTIEHIEG